MLPPPVVSVGAAKGVVVVGAAASDGTSVPVVRGSVGTSLTAGAVDDVAAADDPFIFRYVRYPIRTRATDEPTMIL
jgi:hypothetical protein